MFLPLLAAAGIGSLLGYLSSREQAKIAREMRGIFESMPTPTMEFLEEVKKYGLRQALEKYGYSELQKQLENAYKMQVSSVLQRTGRSLALAGVPTGLNPMAALGKLRQPLDIAYLQKSAGLSFDMLKSLLDLYGLASSEAQFKTSGMAGAVAQKPNVWQDIFAGGLAGLQLGANLYLLGEQAKDTTWDWVLVKQGDQYVPMRKVRRR